MKMSKKSVRPIVYAVLLLIVVFCLFFWYTYKNYTRIEEQNRNYAEDSAHKVAQQIDYELKNGLNLINTYAYFLEQPDIEEEYFKSSEFLKEIESNSRFDVVRFTDINGISYTSEGGTTDSSDCDYYIDGMKGNGGTSIIFDSGIKGEGIRITFYTPIRSDEKIIGVLRGSYTAESYLKNMLSSTYFGEESHSFLCLPEGKVIASSTGELYEKNILEVFRETNVIDEETAGLVENVFKNGGHGAFICDDDSKTDNICVTYVGSNEYVLVQIFPKNITDGMVDKANLAGIQLEIGLIILFVLYIVFLIVHSGKDKKKLERENRQVNYVLKGLNTLFSSRYFTVDLENGSYSYMTTTDLDPTFSNKTILEGDYTQVINNESEDIIGLDDKKEFKQSFKIESIIKNLSEKDIFTYECHVMRNGKEEWEHLNAVCIEREEGKAAKILYVRQNVTELKKRELSRQQEIALMNRKERQYRIAIISNSFNNFEFNLTKDLIEQDVTSDISKDGKVSLLEKIGVQIPCKATECFEKWKQFVLPESHEEYSKVVNIDYLKKQFENGRPEVDVDYWSVSDDRSKQICVRQSFIMTRDEITNDILVMVVTKDITEQVIKQREQTQALHDALLHAQHANQAKTTFLSNMSHDIRTPMNAIIGFATIAASRIDNKEQVSDCLQKVLASSNHLLSLINDILDMSRIESGKLQLHNQECNIPELMHNLVNILQPQVKAKQLELFIDTFEVTNEDVITDPLKLNQVFINLMSNAVKYTHAGGTVSFRIMQNTTFKHGYGDYVFVIKDNGIGMSKEFVEHIFEPFTRETTTTKSGIQGTGLGMAITKNIIEMMNGTIEVESELGKGSTFTVNLMLKLQDVEKNAEQIKELAGLRALVVDDDFNVCDSVSKMLKKIGMRSEWTTSGREAAHRARIARDDGDSFHTFIIDWQMPGTSGIETAKRIRKVVGNEMPIIILTAYDWTDIEEEAKEAGITAFCAKPLFMSDLKSALLSANHLSKKEEKDSAVWKKIDFSGKRILVVEDIELNREIAEVILTESGFEVECAPDGTDAVDMVNKSEENYYDAILMDVQMPIMNGYEATRNIRALSRNDIKTLPIIAMTANALEEDKEAALKSGMNDHISKPIDIERFLEVLGKYLH